MEVIEYEYDSDHSQVDSFIEELSNRFDNTKKPKVEQRKYDVFLSHSSKDQITADRIIQVLKLNNHKVWDYRENLRPGSEWQQALEVALNESKFMLFLITENYSQSKWFEKELSLGLLKQLENKLTVLIVVIGDVNIPSDLSSTLYLKLERDFSDEDLLPLFRALAIENE